MDITGQVIFRESSMLAPDNSGRKLMMIVGVIALPKDTEFLDEHQYVITGNDKGIFAILKDSEIDQTQVTRGLRLDQMVVQPIWKV